MASKQRWRLLRNFVKIAYDQGKQVLNLSIGVMEVELMVTSAALDCFQREWAFGDGEQIRVFIRYISEGDPPFAFGITRDTPVDAVLTTAAGPLTFYMERKDVWFLEGNRLTIDCHGEDIVFRVL